MKNVQGPMSKVQCPGTSGVDYSNWLSKSVFKFTRQTLDLGHETLEFLGEKVS
jgi:hypothetical protein